MLHHKIVPILVSMAASICQRVTICFVAAPYSRQNPKVVNKVHLHAKRVFVYWRQKDGPYLHRNWDREIKVIAFNGHRYACTQSIVTRLGTGRNANLHQNCLWSFGRNEWNARVWHIQQRLCDPASAEIVLHWCVKGALFMCPYVSLLSVAPLRPSSWHCRKRNR